MSYAHLFCLRRRTNIYLVWDNVYGFDFSPLKENALSEPLVDTVEMKTCVTNPARVFTIDLYTVTVEELGFSAPFKLKVERNDFVHAIIAWFDIDFTACHVPIKFTTGPHAKYTHWKQTVFYLAEILTVEAGESISGVLVSQRNAKKPRDLDISISYKLETDDRMRMAEGKCEYKMYI